MLDALFKAFAELLAFSYRLIPSYGMAIIILTVVVRLVLFPLTAKQAKSMQAMQRVQPELKRLQQKYKNDRQKLNEEMMKFYKENQINPLAGCLPLLLQLPLFIVLYRVIAGLTHTVIAGAIIAGGVGTGPLAGAQVVGGHVTGATIQHGTVVKGTWSGAEVDVGGKKVGNLAGAKIVNGVIGTAEVRDNTGNLLGTLTAIRVEGDAKVVGDPKYIRKNTELYGALSKAGGKMVSWGVDLAKTAGSSHGDFGTALPYYVLVALTVLTGYYQQRQMTAKNPQAAANPQAQMMGKIFPLMFGLISMQISAGVVVYFVVSNFWQIGQQALIFRNPGGGATPAKGTKPPKPPKDEGAKALPPAKSNKVTQSKGQRPAKPGMQTQRRKGGK